MLMRVGLGFDAHPFEPGRTLFLGGVAIEHDRGLAGHSDGDVLAHAIVDAVLGAVGLGDIGEHFPSTDERWKDAPSLQFVAAAAASVRAAGFRVENLDATVICEEPRLGPHREEMEARLAQALGVSRNQVHVKATTTDGMGFTGRREGVAAIAVALLTTD